MLGDLVLVLVLVRVRVRVFVAVRVRVEVHVAVAETLRRVGVTVGALVFECVLDDESVAELVAVLVLLEDMLELGVPVSLDEDVSLELLVWEELGVSVWELLGVPVEVSELEAVLVDVSELLLLAV